MTPLMYAVKQGNVDVVRTLVENGRADVNVTENVSSFNIANLDYGFTCRCSKLSAGHGPMGSTKKHALNNLENTFSPKVCFNLPA